MVKISFIRGAFQSIGVPHWPVSSQAVRTTCFESYMLEQDGLLDPIFLIFRRCRRLETIPCLMAILCPFRTGALQQRWPSNSCGWVPPCCPNWMIVAGPWRFKVRGARCSIFLVGFCSALHAFPCPIARLMLAVLSAIPRLSPPSIG